MRKAFYAFVLFSVASFHLLAQKPASYTSADILLSLKKAQTLGKVLYVAAHPDDENTRLITWLANERHLSTAYLSVTRGDGGQNLIGSEIREQLGIIRTQELLAARRTDGGTQYFTRANDFGFSKNPEETFTIWDKEVVLADMVWVIRKFRPDVIITRFSAEPSDTHGHHTASAILAAEAFEAAGDKNRFPEQLIEVEVWQAKRLLWNTSWWFYGREDNFDATGLVKLDVGTYNPLLGKSYGEIAAESRSMHKSQGFGSSGARGSSTEYLKPLKGAALKSDFMDDIETTWKRVAGADKVKSLLEQAEKQFNPQKPALIIPTLVAALKEADKLKDSFWKQQKQDEIKELIYACAGLYVEVATNDASAVAGQSVDFTVELVNRSNATIRVSKVQLPAIQWDSTLTQPLVANQKITFKKSATIPTTSADSQPYWLQKEGSLGMFSVDHQHLIGLPENPPTMQAQFELLVDNYLLKYTKPVVYKSTDPVDGEAYKPFIVTPEVFVRLAESVFVFNKERTKQVEVKLKAGRNSVAGSVQLNVPKGWSVHPASMEFKLSQKGEEQGFIFEVQAPETESDVKISARAIVNGRSYNRSLAEINYKHIPLQTLFPEASAKAIKLNLTTKAQLIGYVMGAGDDIPANLQQIGYQVQLIDLKTINDKMLAQFDAIVLGVRAYNTVEELKFANAALLDYVKNGGNLIVQYNTNSRMVTPNIAPYDLKIGRDRVTVEQAVVRILQAHHPLVNSPNKITEQDFEGWVQERGLYFAQQWAPEFQAVFSANDPNEPPRNGGMLVAQYGKGYYVYTGYSWFRQLPAGVPGAYRIFVNMIELGK